MSDLAPPDLSFAKQQVEAMMADEISFTRDLEGSSDDLLDNYDLSVSPQAGEPGQVWQGMCMVTSIGAAGVDTVEVAGRVIPSGRKYRVLLPLGAPEIQAGDRGEMISSKRNANLVGRRLAVREAVQTTFNISQTLLCELESLI